RRAVAEKNPNRAIASDFDRVSLPDKVADFGLNTSAPRARDRDRAAGRVDFADCLASGDAHRLSEAVHNTITRRIADATEHAGPSPLANRSTVSLSLLGPNLSQSLSPTFVPSLRFTPRHSEQSPSRWSS